MYNILIYGDEIPHFKLIDYKTKKVWVIIITSQKKCEKIKWLLFLFISKITIVENFKFQRPTLDWTYQQNTKQILIF